MSNQLVSLIIVYAGKCCPPEKLLLSVRAQTHLQREVLLIDNSPAGDLALRTKALDPEICVLKGKDQQGYCQALNKGIAASRGDFILCLNDDVILENTFLERALTGFYVSPEIGMVSGKILRQDLRTVDSAGLFLSIWRSPLERGYGTPDKGQYDEPGYIFGVNGAVAFYRRSMLEQVKLKEGYFDPDFGIFYEDLDLAWRAQNSGWKAYYVPSAIAYHVRGATVRKNSGIDRPMARRYLSDPLYARLFKNRYYTIMRNERICAFLLHLPFMLFYDGALWAHLLFTRPALALKATFNLKAWRGFLQKLRSIASQRRKTARKIPAQSKNS